MHSHGRKPPRECVESTNFARMQPVSGMQGAAELSRGASVRDVCQGQFQIDPFGSVMN